MLNVTSLSSGTSSRSLLSMKYFHGDEIFFCVLSNSLHNHYHLDAVLDKLRDRFQLFRHKHLRLFVGCVTGLLSCGSLKR